MKVKCINNNIVNPANLGYPWLLSLTINKIYEAVERSPGLYDIIDDKNENNVYFSDRFIDIREDRKQKLEKLKCLKYVKKLYVLTLV
jgi:hypothetical protein